MIFFFLSVMLFVLAILSLGLVNFSVAHLIPLASIPLVLIYKLCGNRPMFLLPLLGFASALSVLNSCWHLLAVPVHLYGSLWGVHGTMAGLFTILFLPLEPIVFLIVAFQQPNAEVLIRFYLAHVFFIAGVMFLLSSMATPSIWTRWSTPKDPSEPHMAAARKRAASVS